MLSTALASTVGKYSNFPQERGLPVRSPQDADIRAELVSHFPGPRTSRSLIRWQPHSG